MGSGPHLELEVRAVRGGGGEAPRRPGGGPAGAPEAGAPARDPAPQREHDGDELAASSGRFLTRRGGTARCASGRSTLKARDAGVGKIDFVDISSPSYRPEENRGISFERAMARGQVDVSSS